jgi:hypothetical protein
LAHEQAAATTMNESWLLWGLLFGSIGLGFFMYGRKQSSRSFAG